MSIKEFSQKNGEALFYTSIVLLIISIVLGVSLCCNNNGKSGKNGPENFNRQMRNGGGMMQNNDIRPNTQKGNFPSGVNQNTTDQGAPQADNNSAPVAPTTTPTVQ